MKISTLTLCVVMGLTGYLLGGQKYNYVFTHVSPTEGAVSCVGPMQMTAKRLSDTAVTVVCTPLQTDVVTGAKK